VRGVDAAARAYSTDGLAAAQAFGDATGSILSSFKEQLLFAQAIGSGDFAIDAQKLGLFEQGMRQTLAVAGRLGAQAALIPPGNIAALQNTTAALTAAYESMIRLSAVPFGNLPQLTGALGGGGGGGSVVNNVTINTLPGQNTQQIADAVIQRLGQRIGSRH
jgi:hypothetical protein